MRARADVAHAHAVSTGTGTPVMRAAMRLASEDGAGALVDEDRVVRVIEHVLVVGRQLHCVLLGAVSQAGKNKHLLA
jgi:hypothetical protein